MTTKIQYRRDTAANWASSNPVLSAGEPGHETDTGKTKVGNGTTVWNQLAYQGQVDLSGYATSTDLTAVAQQKVNQQTYTAKVSELESAIGARYTKPSTGIPATDFTTATRAALTAAGTAVQPAALDGFAPLVSGKVPAQYLPDGTSGGGTNPTVVDGGGAAASTNPDTIDGGGAAA